MRFPAASNQSASVPLALQYVDAKLGTNSQEAYLAAVEKAPYLAGIAIVADDTLGNHFQPSNLGLGGSYVSVNPDRDHYIDAIQKGVISWRMKPFSDLYRSKGILPRAGELAVASFLHELGHADGLHGQIEIEQGDTAKAYTALEDRRRRELSTLPLQGSTSRAIRAWENNIDRYRDLMLAKGITEEDWRAMHEPNTRAYSAVPMEAAADDFALSVLQSVELDASSTAL